jgi:GNAT superfamily N-acetyltransferase
MKINEIITEVFNPETSFPIEWNDRHSPEEMHGRAYDRQGGFIDIKFIALRNGVVEVEFSRNDSYDMTGAGDANRVLATILEAFREYLQGYRPKIFVFSAKGGSRSKVYQNMINRFAAGAGYKQFDTAKLSDKARKQLGHSGSDVMILRRAAVAEAFDKPYAFKWQRGDHGDYDILVKLPDGSPLSITFNHEGDNEWHVAFERGHSQDITGEGDAQRIFATVLTSIQKFIKKHKPQQLTFSAIKDVEPNQNSESRAKLYNRLVDRYATSWGYDALINDLGDQVEYELTRLQPVTEEEFNGIDIDMDIEGDEIMVTAMANGRELGHVLFVDEGEYLMPQDLEVDERYQGQGIAAAMYDYVKSKGYKIRRSGQQTDAGAGFWGKHRPEQNVWENFADGKVKGKSRPGRVKRAGASCNGSVTDLRARAKNASGEKAKMYHWCANMKSGRNK